MQYIEGLTDHQAADAWTGNMPLQPSPTPRAQQVALIALTEQGGSGFHGSVTLLSNNDETEIVVGIIPPPPSLFGFGKSEEDIGNVEVYEGFCGVLSQSVEDLGVPTEPYRFDGDERGFYALRHTLDMSIDELLDGDHAVVLLQRPGEEESPSPGLGAQQEEPEQPDALACGRLVPESRVGPATSQ